jgi:hypothetical protein
MKPYPLDSGFQVLFEDGERVLRRGWCMDDDGDRSCLPLNIRRRQALIVSPTNTR